MKIQVTKVLTADEVMMKGDKIREKQKRRLRTEKEK